MSITMVTLLQQIQYLSKALSGCVHGLGPCGPGSNPGRETITKENIMAVLVVLVIMFVLYQVLKKY